MFFSFTTDNGSRGGHSPDDSDLDDSDDPHLRLSNASRLEQGRYSARRLPMDDDDDDPYLRLDEDDGPQRFNPRNTHSSRYNAQNVPLISSEIDDSRREGSETRGWLAHQASPLRRARSPSPSPSGSSSSSSSPPPDIFSTPNNRPKLSSPRSHQPPLPPPTSRNPISLSLTESLLPRDGVSRPVHVFSLPDPRHTPRSRRKYHDSIWTALWLTGVTICLVASLITLIFTRKPPKRAHLILPYTTLLHTVPLLTILTVLSACAAYLHIWLLKVFVKPVMIATSMFVPATLFISAICAFVGSFMWDGDTEPTWGETVGLRLFALVPLLLSLFTARRLLHLPQILHMASSTLDLSTKLLTENPFLLALSPAILLCASIISIPFLTLVFRLLLIGYTTGDQVHGSLEWHVRGWANWAIVFTVCIWLWTWGVARGILKMTCAGVIGSWYFADPVAPPPSPTSTHTIHAAIVRSTQPSLGSIALAALVLTVIRLLTLTAVFLHNLPTYVARFTSSFTTFLPAAIGIPIRTVLLGAGTSVLRASLLQGIAWCIGTVESITSAFSRYALIYGGLTGDAFMDSARRAQALTRSVEQRAQTGRRKFKSEPPMALLTIAPLTLTFPFALITYLFVAHTLGAPDQALGAAILAGGVTALVGMFSVGLVEDTVDTLYICYCIDKDLGERRRKEVFSAFEYESRAPVPPAPQPDASRPMPRPPVQHQRQPSYAQARQPLPQPSPHSHSPPLVMPSSPLINPIESPQPSHRPRTPSQLPAPAAVEEDDDINPFEPSYLEDNTVVQPARASSPRPPVRSPTQPSFGAQSSAGSSASASRSHSRNNSLSRSLIQSRAAVAAELDKKPVIRPFSPVSSPLAGSATRGPEASRQSDNGSDGSQFFPGSGFF
ncbi:hypothetical protein PC9H_000659 [Pleurotus ostreatus]|uniref:Plasma-membrane choline transporter-domain-containing protein n=1 Tax=Pleurotus ostreatus TaxID=5322 RepID=A0A8H7DX12_PLEOS|nr:uncharacterized protein PC9H_000659 [Pleurotus ostreatus]KAF7440315.1 hypothetical protein PC9H_000659 [Pleurotus ostreatus]